MYFPVSAGVLIAIVILKLILVSQITRLRLGHKVVFGDGGNSQLGVAIRAHANLLENAPLAILLFLVAELQGANHWLLAALGLVFVAARLAHAHGIIRAGGETHPGRYWGTLLSWLTLVALSLLLLWQLLLP